MTKRWTDYNCKILILGIMHSGTSLLASYLGAHPDVTILSEVPDNWELRMIGKPVTGVKLLAPQQYRGKGYEGYKVIKIMRDPDDLLNSLRTRTRNKQNKKWYWKLLWKLPIHRFMAAWGYYCMMGVNGFTVDYEMICSDPEYVLEQVCEYLDITYTDKMLEGRKYNYAYQR